MKKITAITSNNKELSEDDIEAAIASLFKTKAISEFDPDSKKNIEYIFFIHPTYYKKNKNTEKFKKRVGTSKVMVSELVDEDGFKVDSSLFKGPLFDMKIPKIKKNEWYAQFSTSYDCKFRFEREYLQIPPTA